MLHRSEPASGSVAPKHVVFSPAIRDGMISVRTVSLTWLYMCEGPSTKLATRGVVRKALAKPIMRWPAPYFRYKASRRWKLTGAGSSSPPMDSGANIAQ
jgi:hypothetical protein